jgi:hypothetical protein
MNEISFKDKSELKDRFSQFLSKTWANCLGLASINGMETNRGRGQIKNEGEKRYVMPNFTDILSLGFHWPNHH